MKAKKLLSVFIAVTIILTTMLILGVVSYAAQTVYPIMSVDFGDPVQSGENYTYTATVYLENYGTLSGEGAVHDETAKTVTDTGDYSGTKIKDWTLYMAFENEGAFVSEGDATSKLEVIGSYEDGASVAVAPTMMMNYDESANTLKVVSSTDGSIQKMYPYYGTVTEKLTLGTFVFTTNTDTFTVTLSGDIQLGETAEDGGFVDGIEASTYATGDYANKAAGNKALIMDVVEPEVVLETRVGAAQKKLTDTNMRRLYFYAGIDSLNYKSVGYEVTIAGRTAEIETSTVYTKINVTMNGNPVTLTPTAFGDNVNYIFGQGLQVPESFGGQNVQVRAYAENFDGTKTYTVTNNFTIADN